ncbi:MAG: tRNA pseudouridine(55) synthase TruB [Armatimonadota bacterium]|nr:tRNA pseudouridine(55) synthase TruB [Armatimonadota bacterium]
MPEGLLNMLKPPGMTSHDVVDRVREIIGLRRVGHTGTLDPAAAGVMVLMVGGATRLSEYLTARDKVYRAEITLGLATDTLDGEGVIVERRDAGDISREAAEEALAALTGEMEITPPLHSAVRHQGKRLYEIARAGGEVAVETRQVTIRRFELLDFRPGELTRLLAEIECSSGTYVRSLAAMVGERLERPAYLSLLVRTRVGNQRVQDSLTGTELSEAVRAGRLEETLIAPEDALEDWPRIGSEHPEALDLCRGLQIRAPASVEPGGHVLVMTPDDRLLCVAELVREGGETMVQPRRVLLGEDEI